MMVTNAGILVLVALFLVGAWAAAKLIQFNHKAWRQNFIDEGCVVHLEDWGKN